jgi:hypothetical protein
MKNSLLQDLLSVASGLMLLGAAGCGEYGAEQDPAAGENDPLTLATRDGEKVNDPAPESDLLASGIKSFQLFKYAGASGSICVFGELTSTSTSKVSVNIGEYSGSVKKRGQGSGFLSVCAYACIPSWTKGYTYKYDIWDSGGRLNSGAITIPTSGFTGPSMPSWPSGSRCTAR